MLQLPSISGSPPSSRAGSPGPPNQRTANLAALEASSKVSLRFVRDAKRSGEDVERWLPAAHGPALAAAAAAASEAEERRSSGGKTW